MDEFQEDFEIAYSGQATSQRQLKDGKYIVAIKSVKPLVCGYGKYKGNDGLEWRFTIIEGELAKLDCIVSTLLSPSNMLWTTDRIINAAYPSIQKGQKISLGSLIGQQLELSIKTRPNKNGDGTSIYVDVTYTGPYVASGSAGSFDSFSPR
jgi:hypothetical protein